MTLAVGHVLSLTSQIARADEPTTSEGGATVEHPHARPKKARPPEGGGDLLGAGGGLTYEVRAQLSMIATPERVFGLTGQCSLGSGLEPASLYGQTARAGGVGGGGGAGARLGWMYRSGVNPTGAASFWGLRAGTGLDVLVYDLRAPVGIPTVDRHQLCSNVAKARHELEYEFGVRVLTQIPIDLGVHVAFGHLDARRWRGVVLGMAWTPSFGHLGSFVSTSGSYFNPLGLELTFDFAVLDAHRTAREPQVRAALSLAPRTAGAQPTLVTASLGAAWY